MSALQKKLFSKGILPPVASLRVVNTNELEPLSFENYFEQRTYVDVGYGKFRVYSSGNSGPIFVLLHGAGHSALVWGLVTKILNENEYPCRIMAFDCRYHGGTKIFEDTDSWDYKLLVKDCVNIVNKYYENIDENIILVGHSMGGAIAIHVSEQNETDNENFIKNLKGLIVIDVVEGTAMEALGSMKQILNNIPKFFSSKEQAIDWV